VFFVVRFLFLYLILGYGGMEASELKRIKELEEENAKLKRMYANLALDLETARYIIEKKL
jgi:putative transposase